MKKLVFACMVPFLFLVSCTHEFLEIKPDKKLRVPTSIEDFEALLNKTEVHNYGIPSLGEISSDDYYLTDNQWKALLYESERNGYLWLEDIFGGKEALVSDGWYHPYQQILYANMALEGLELLKDHDDNRKKELRSRALFYRAWAYFHLSQLFAYPLIEPYVKQPLGIPIKLDSDINFRSKRAMVGEVYERIFEDLYAALDHLPDRTNRATIPGKQAVHGLLAKIYLQVDEYEKALEHAQACLAIYNKLIDYNEIDPSVNFPFSRLNDEVIFHSSMAGTQVFSQVSFLVDTGLYNLYDSSDLRKQLFFFQDNSGVRYKGSYNGDQWFFGGIATDEMLLIRAECYARIGDVSQAAHDLNELLKHRYKLGESMEVQILERQELIQKILLERRKQLVFRGIRWHDLRRFNFSNVSEASFSITRNIEGNDYILDPKNLRYVLPIPPDVIKISGIDQNPR